jgi:hypothetical protein
MPLKILTINTIFILILAISCSQKSISDNMTYYGLDDFGYQWDNPSPYSEWISRREEGNTRFHFRLEGPNGYVAVEFVPINDLSSLQDAIYILLGMKPTDYEVLSEQVYNSNSHVINNYQIKENQNSDSIYTRIAMFQFDNRYWAIVHGRPESGNELRFNNAFETILFSLRPFRPVQNHKPTN